MAMESLTGQDLNGYLVGPQIGDGGMGEVYQAYAPGTNEKVAVKVLRGEFSGDIEYQQRFVREIRLMQALQHEHIIPILDYGTTTDQIYYVMKFINGPTLDRVMKNRTFTPVDLWYVLNPIASGLHHGHTKGIVHRDVKPGNIIVERIGREGSKVYLMDFGLGKRPGVDSNLTAQDVMVGTPEYMSPEAVMGREELDYQTDVYSLAVMTYELSLGVLPIQKRAPHLTAMAQVKEPPISMRERNSEYPALLEKVILKGLAKEKSRRYKSVKDFATAYYDAARKLSGKQVQTSYWVK